MLSVAQKILMQDTGNKGEGERSVFTYTTDSETRSFRSIAQKIQARSGDGILYKRGGILDLMRYCFSVVLFNHGEAVYEINTQCCMQSTEGGM